MNASPIESSAVKKNKLGLYAGYFSCFVGLVLCVPLFIELRNGKYFEVSILAMWASLNFVIGSLAIRVSKNR